MSEIDFSKELKATNTPIEGLVVYDLPVHGDSRGWFKENWQREKMSILGLPDFGPVQNNISFNDKRGVARGIHAEPWDKYVSIAVGKVFGFWVDMREDSTTYGKVFTSNLDPSRAIFVPRGVANGYQTLEDNTAYTYLVNDHWSPDAEYLFVSMFDESLGIDWPIPLAKSEVSDKDRNHPLFAETTPIKPKKILITGANGQLGQALQTLYPEADRTNRHSLDVASTGVFTARHWKDYSTIINAAAYTAVDLAETDGRAEAWQTNAVGVTNLAQIAHDNQITLVHISSDYVFDGTHSEHNEEEPFTPLNVYGQSKAAGDIAASTAPQHYIIRTSWVVGKGKNFIRTMKGLAEKGGQPSVVDDQIGRLTFTDDLAAAIKYLVDTKADYGTYNFSNDGEPASWADIAKKVYGLAGHDPDEVIGVATDHYRKEKESTAPRPHNSTLDLSKIKAVGFIPRDWQEALDVYWNELSSEE